MAKFNWSFKLSGIGPFSRQLTSTLNLTKSRVAIYAGNGTGKTSISRMFRLAESQGVADPSKFITRGSDTGNFEFSVSENGKSSRCLTVSLDRNGDAQINNDTGYLFHTFNSGYVAENLAARSYSPSGDIEGYIVGRLNIDLTEDRVKAEELKSKGLKLRNEIEHVLEVAKSELKSAGINPRMKGFSELTYDRLIEMEKQEDSYNSIRSALSEIDSLPDDAAAPNPLDASYSHTDLPAISRLLGTRYSKANQSEAFLESIRRKVSFVQAGMTLQDGTTCPFCGQRYDNTAQALIHEYDKYLHDQEKQIMDSIESAKSTMRRLVDDRQRTYANFQRAKSTYITYKTGFSDLDAVLFPDMTEPEDFDEHAAAVIAQLDQKKSDIARAISPDTVDALQTAIAKDQRILTAANEAISKLDEKLQSLSREKTKLRKRLCEEALNRCRIECDHEIVECLATRTELIRLNEEIRAKEAQGRRTKREAVADLFHRLLAEIFGDKYDLDPAFSLTLNGTSLGSDAAMVLSDGEKSIIAFCYYVASTFAMLNHDEDANKLFFVIDDPISSMDFHHVYGVAQIIRSLQNYFKLKNTRVLLLTHNTTFFNMLIANNIAAKAFSLNSREIVPCEARVTTPYTEHLIDIYRVANGDKPCHTTGNSIRQVLESIMRFESPRCRDLQTYLSSDRMTELNSTEYIYTLCNDQSHGHLPSDSSQPIDTDSIRRACQAVVDYVEKHYPEQLNLQQPEDADSK